MELTKIYTLEDPRDNIIRYVGKTKQTLNKRLSTHLCPRENTHTNNWIRSLQLVGLRPIITQVDEVLTSEWQFWEKHYISLFKSWGFNLTNIQEGGDDYSYNIRPRVGEDNKANKPIMQLDKQGNVINVFISTIEAVKFTSLSKSSLIRCLSGEVTYDGGFDWKRISREEYNKYKEQPKINTYIPKHNKAGLDIIAIFSDGSMAGFKSMCEAARVLKVQQSHIWSVINGDRKHTKGIKFYTYEETKY